MVMSCIFDVHVFFLKTYEIFHHMHNINHIKEDNLIYNWYRDKGIKISLFQVSAIPKILKVFFIVTNLVSEFFFMNFTVSVVALVHNGGCLNS